MYSRLGGHLPESERARRLPLEVKACTEQLGKVVESMVGLFEELGLEDLRKV